LRSKRKERRKMRREQREDLREEKLIDWPEDGFTGKNWPDFKRVTRT